MFFFFKLLKAQKHLVKLGGEWSGPFDGAQELQRDSVNGLIEQLVGSAEGTSWVTVKAQR